MAFDSKRLKQLFRIGTGSTPRSEEPRYWNGDIPWVTPEDLGRVRDGVVRSTARCISRAGLGSCAATLTSSGSLVLSTRAPIGHVAGTAFDFAINQGCRTLTPLEGVYAPFYSYVLTTRRSELQALGRGSTFQELSTQDLGNVSVPSPGYEAQRDIVRFLDEQAASVGQLIEQKLRFAALKEEERSVSEELLVIDRRLKDDSLRGNNSMHRRRLRDIVSLIQCGPFGSQLHFDDYVSGGTPVVNPQNIIDNRISPSSDMTVGPEMVRHLKRHTLRDGDIVMARRGAMGRCATAGRREAGWLCGTGSMIVRPRWEVVLPSFVHLLLSSRFSRSWLLAEAVGTTMSNLSASIVGRLPVNVPPISEQRGIVERIESARTLSSSLTQLTAHSAKSLYEYREALITAAVSGDIDVRKAA